MCSSNIQLTLTRRAGRTAPDQHHNHADAHAAPSNTPAGCDGDRSCHRGCHRHRRSGFSLIELMVVLVIIGVLAGIVSINVRGYLIRGKQSAARVEVATICDALESFYSLHDRYPTNEEGIAILAERSERMPESLLDRLPTDPWGRPYQYNQPGREEPYEVISFGADGQEGGDGADTDIVSWQLQERRP